MPTTKHEMLTALCIRLYKARLEAKNADLIFDFSKRIGLYTEIKLLKHLLNQTFKF